MIDPRRVTPLLTNMSVDREIGRGPNGTVYQVTRRLDGKKLALKHISIPANDAQTSALIYAGAVSDEAEANRYYSLQVQDIKSELLQLNGIENAPNLLKFRGYQVDQKIIGIGFDIYLLEDLCQSLPEFLLAHHLTKLQAVNLGIDLCSSLEQLRSANLYHKDVRPNNIFHDGSHFLLGDLGLTKKDELPYNSMPDQLITEYTAPEIVPEDSCLNETMDIYSIGLILYEIYNGYSLPSENEEPFVRSAEDLPCPEYADETLSEIILKACAYNPEERYQDPSEMKQALVLYLQRNDVGDELLIPPSSAPEGDVDLKAIAATVEAGQAIAAEASAEETSVEEAESITISDGSDASSIASAASVPESSEESVSIDDHAEDVDATKVIENIPEEMLTDMEAGESTLDPDMNEHSEVTSDELAEWMQAHAHVGIDEVSTDIEGDAILSDTAESVSHEDAPDSENEFSSHVEPEPVVSDIPEDTVKFSLNDLSDDDLLVPTAGEISVEDFLASIRTTPGLEVLSMDSSGNTITVPGYETEETLPDDTQFVDSADTRVMPDYESDSSVPSVSDLGSLSVADTQSTEDAPVPGTINETEVPASVPETRRLFRKKKEVETVDDEEYDEEDDYDDEYDDGYDDDEYYDYDDTSSSWKKALIAIIVLLVLAGGAFAGYTFKTDTVSDMRSEVLSSSSVLVKADRKNDSSMDVVCSTATGEVARMPLGSNGATFTGLNPSTTYTFTMKSSDGKLLLGSKSIEAKTAQMTNLTGFAASSLSAVSADLVISGTGDQPESWIINCVGNNGDAVSVTARDASQAIHVDGLTPDTTYTATISRGDGDQLGGTTTCEFTTQGYTELISFESTSVTINSATVQWSYSGTVPNTWTIICEGTDGSSTTQDISGTECTLDGLEPGVTYTITLDCPSLKATELKTINVNIPTVTVTEIVSELNEDGNIEVHWEYTGDITPKEWNISYNYRTENPVTPTLVTTTTNSITLENLIPEAEYTITIENADDLLVGGTIETICVTDSAPDFTEFEASNAELTLYALEDNPDGLENETDSFTADQHLAFAVQVDYEATDEDKTVRTLYVVRGSDGTPVYVYRNDDPGRTWSGSWTTARHTGDLPDMPQKPGSYTLEIYFDGGLLASGDFTVEAE